MLRSLRTIFSVSHPDADAPSRAFSSRISLFPPFLGLPLIPNIFILPLLFYLLAVGKTLCDHSPKWRTVPAALKKIISAVRGAVTPSSGVYETFMISINSVV